VSIGVFSAGDDTSLSEQVRSLLASRTESIQVVEIVVVHSGSESPRLTGDIDSLLRLDRRVTVIRQPRREGKASAVNLFLARAASPLCVLANADTLVAPETIEALCRPLLDPSVGIVGARPVPVAPRRGCLAGVVRLFWELHHRLCLRAPKMGELVAFRNQQFSLPLDQGGADEDWIDAELARRGFRSVYAPEAIVFIRGPANLRELFSHRSRMARLHRQLVAGGWPPPSSRRIGPMAMATLDLVFDAPRHLAWLPLAALIEIAARLWAGLRFRMSRNAVGPWPLLTTTKGISRAEVEAMFEGSSSPFEASRRTGSESTRPRPTAPGACQAPEGPAPLGVVRAEARERARE
jgi:hypothetical protein